MSIPVPEVNFSVYNAPGDGSTTSWNFNFAGAEGGPGYISQDHIKAITTNPLGVVAPVAFTFIGPTTIEIIPAIPVGTELTIYRDTPRDKPLVNFSTTAIMSEANLDKMAQQAVYVAAEMIDRFTESSTNSDAALAAAQAAVATANSAEATADAAEATANGIAGTASAALVAASAAEATADAAAAAVTGAYGFQPAGSGAVAGTVQGQLREYVVRSNYDSDANFNAAKSGKLSRDGTGRLRSTTYIAGSEELVSPTTRDAFVVGRGLTGDTNCHGYADRTVISGVTDAGLYGSFDCTVELQGDHNQNHVYSYQDRVRYSGGVAGVLQNSCGFLSQTIHSGAGTILSRNGMQIDPMAVTGGGTISAQTGVRINHLGSASNNVGLFIGQTTGAVGWAMYCPGSTGGVYPLNGAKSYHAGLFGFGLEPIAGVQLSFKYGADTNNKTGFMSSDTNRVIYGAIGDTPISLVLNGDNRVIVENSAQGYALRPYLNGSQSLGLTSAFWSQVYATNVTLKPPASVTPANNGEMTFELTSNTQLKIKVKGSDGIVRSTTLTLA